MKKDLLKSIGAILAGFLVGVALSYSIDAILRKAEILNDPFTFNPSWLVIVVILYRFASNVIGCYVIAWLAPNKPMKHVIIMGIIGTVLSLTGAATMWDYAVVWYNIAIILMSIPSAWVGGKLYLTLTKNKKWVKKTT